LSKVSAKQKHVRIMNQNLIIDAIRRDESATRSELSKLLQLSVPSVCTNADQLVRLGILRETEDGFTGVGRKASRLRLNDNFGYIISVDLSNPCITVGISNLNPIIIQEVKFDIEQYDINQLMELIISKIDELLVKSNVLVNQLRAISISIPGQVDNDLGIVKCGSYLERLGTVNFREPLQNKFGVRVLVQKDINSAVLGEIKFGAAQGHANAVFVSVDVGVGLGIVLGGSLYPGKFHLAGEIEDYIVNAEEENTERPDGLFRSSRLRDFVTIEALVRSVRAELEAGGESRLLKAVNGDIVKVDFNDIIKATLEGDALSVKHVKRCAKIMAAFIANMLFLLDLDTVILGGGFVTLGSAYTDTIRDEVRRLGLGNTAIVDTALKTKAVLIGGIAIGLETMFSELLEEQEA